MAPKEQFAYLGKALTKPQKLKVLKRTRELLERPGGWVQGTFWTGKYTKQGLREDIPKMCLAGAAQWAAGELGYLSGSGITQYDRLATTEVADHISLRDLAREKGFEGVPEFNDRSRTRKKDVLALIDERIAQLQAKA